MASEVSHFHCWYKGSTSPSKVVTAVGPESAAREFAAESIGKALCQRTEIDEQGLWYKPAAMHVIVVSPDGDVSQWTVSARLESKHYGPKSE